MNPEALYSHTCRLDERNKRRGMLETVAGELQCIDGCCLDMCHLDDIDV